MLGFFRALGFGLAWVCGFWRFWPPGLKSCALNPKLEILRPLNASPGLRRELSVKEERCGRVQARHLCKSACKYMDSSLKIRVPLQVPKNSGDPSLENDPYLLRFESRYLEMQSQGELRRVLRLGVEKGAAARGRQVNKIRGALLWGLCASVSLSSAKRLSEM